MDSMNIVIVGPGSMGCLLASFLDGTGREVALLDKDADRARILAAQGVHVIAGGGVRVVPVSATADPARVTEADIILVCVKAYDTESALDRIAPFVSGHAVVASFQNGLGHAETLAHHTDTARTVCAVTGQGATHLGVGRIAHAGQGLTRVAPYSPDRPDAARQLVALLEEIGLETRYDPDRNRTLWSKLIINAGINPVTALADIPNGALLDRPDLFARAQAAALEAYAVAAALGVTLDRTDVVAELRRVCEKTATNVSSMLQDIRKGKRTEIDALNGAVAREGRRLGVPVPVNVELTETIRRREGIV